MNIAIDISPLKNGRFLQHRVRGTGFYLENLKRSLLKYFPDNTYTFFTRGEKLSINIDLEHYPYFEPFFLTLPILSKYKRVVTVHDMIPLVFPDNFPKGIKGNVKWAIQRHSLMKADAIITDSLSSKKDVAKYGNISNKKIFVVYLSAGEEFKKIQDSEFRIRKLKKKYNLPEKFVLYVGDATWNKNLPRLVEAIKKIDIPLVMIGKALVQEGINKLNPWNYDIIRVQELVKGDDRIILPGFVSTEELVLLYNIATVFAMPSLYEGFGLPLLEAMNCGAPVVTTRESSIPEVVENAAFFVDAYSIDSIASGIKEVFLNTKLQKEISDKGLMQAKKFTWKKTAENTIKVYEKVLV